MAEEAALTAGMSSGKGGRSIEPRLILTIIALALPRVGLSVIELIGSSSPSKALFTTKAIKSSVFAKEGRLEPESGLET